MWVAHRATMEQRQGDVSWSEIAAKVKIIGTVVALLIGAELFYRWMTQPEDSFSLYQEFITWIWYNLHSLIFGADSISMTTKNGLDTVVILSHPSISGSEMSPLWVSDECVGIHEIAFVSFMIIMTPGITRNNKLRGIVSISLVLSILNIVRLLVLYPLAVNGCKDSPGDFGCWAPVWEFHEFMLKSGFMLVILIGWTAWYLIVGGPAKTRDIRDISSLITLPTEIKQRQPLPQWSIAVLLMAAVIASSAVYTLSFDSEAEKERLEAEGCEGIVSAICGEEIREWDNISGKAWRTLLVSGVVSAIAITKVEWNSKVDEEE
jgi:exosortase/archaeosortase family protein